MSKAQKKLKGTSSREVPPKLATERGGTLDLSTDFDHVFWTGDVNLLTVDKTWKQLFHDKDHSASVNVTYPS